MDLTVDQRNSATAQQHYYWIQPCKVDSGKLILTFASNSEKRKKGKRKKRKKEKKRPRTATICTSAYTSVPSGLLRSLVEKRCLSETNELAETKTGADLDS